MSVENGRKTWISENVVVDVPPHDALDVLVNPDTLPLLFPEYGIEVEPHREIGKGTRLHLARVAFGLDHDVRLHVQSLSVNLKSEEVARLILAIEQSRVGKGTTIESALFAHTEGGRSVLSYDVIPPEEGGLIYNMPLGRGLVRRAVRHEIRQVPDRIKQIRDRPAA